MGVLNFFKRKVLGKRFTSDEKSSPEQSAFAENVLLIISPSVEKFGFKLVTSDIKTYSTTFVFRKDKTYIKINSTSYPTDYPYFYNIILGEGDSADFSEYDWNSIPLFGLAKIINPLTNVSSYNFPVGALEFSNTIRRSIEEANKHLLKYGSSFLDGDLTIFYQARKSINEQREPYKISVVDKNGNYHTTYDTKSADKKKKYS